MGIWDYVCSSADSLKRNAPHLKPIKDSYSTSYAYGLSAATNIGNAVTANAYKLHTLTQYFPNQEAQHKIVQFTTCLARNAAFESIKFLPGGEFTRKIVAKSYEDVYKSKKDNDQVQVANREALDGMKGRSRSKKLSSEEVVENYKASDDDEEYFKSQTVPNHHQKPEDMIRIFMMKGFMGRQFLDDLIVPVPGVVHSKKNK